MISTKRIRDEQREMLNDSNIFRNSFVVYSIEQNMVRIDAYVRLLANKWSWSCSWLFGIHYAALFLV